jgi:hypothetical protein
LLLRSRSEDEPVAGGVRAAVEAGGGDAGRHADSGRAVAHRELGERNSSRLATPAATPMEVHRHLVGPADNRAILATAKEQVNHAECVVAHQTGRVEALRLILTPCWTRRRLRRLPTRQVLAEHSRRPAVELVPSLGGLSRVRPFRPCPRRVPSSGLQRLPAEQRAARQCFPSSR